MQRQKNSRTREPSEHSRRPDADGRLESQAWSPAESHVDHGQGLQVHQLWDCQRAA